MPAKNFYVALYDPQRDQLEFPYSWTNTIRLETSARSSQWIDRYVLRTGRPLLATTGRHEQLVAAARRS